MVSFLSYSLMTLQLQYMLLSSFRSLCARHFHFVHFYFDGWLLKIIDILFFRFFQIFNLNLIFLKLWFFFKYFAVSANVVT